ncbi:MAG: YdcF family protein [Streptosporangiaceae bacterium]
MTGADIPDDQVAEITAFVDIEAPAPSGKPTAHFIFGTNQPAPALIAADRYRRGLAPLIIATGGVNRHNQINEARKFQRILADNGVPDSAIRIEDEAANTWQNVEFSLPFLREALDSGLAITAISKWYHRRTVHILKTLLPGIGSFHAITWEPVYDGKLVTRTDWPAIPGGRRRVIREWEETTRRVADGSLAETSIADGAWS